MTYSTDNFEGDDYGYVDVMLSPPNKPIKISYGEYEVVNELKIQVFSEKEIGLIGRNNNKICLDNLSEEQQNDNSYISVNFRLGGDQFAFVKEDDFDNIPQPDPSTVCSVVKLEIEKSVDSEKSKGCFAISSYTDAKITELFLNLEKIVSRTSVGNTSISIIFNNVLIDGQKVSFCKRIFVNKVFEKKAVRIKKFYAEKQNVKEGQRTVISWDADGANSFVINPGQIKFKANEKKWETDKIFNNTVFKLTAIGDDDMRDEKELEIYVNDEVNITKHIVERNVESRKTNKIYTYTFTWNVENADSVTVFWKDKKISNEPSGYETEVNYNDDLEYPAYGFKIIAKRHNVTKVWPEERR